MRFELEKRFKIKKGRKILLGPRDGPINNLIICEVDFNNLSVRVHPEGKTKRESFWVKAEDLHENFHKN